MKNFTFTERKNKTVATTSNSLKGLVFSPSFESNHSFLLFSLIPVSSLSNSQGTCGRKGQKFIAERLSDLTWPGFDSLKTW